MTLEQILANIKLHGRPHEWIWRGVVDYGYKFTDIQPQILEAWKYWDRNVNKNSKDYGKNLDIKSAKQGKKKKGKSG